MLEIWKTDLSNTAIQILRKISLSNGSYFVLAISLIRFLTFTLILVSCTLIRVFYWTSSFYI